MVNTWRIMDASLYCLTMMGCYLECFLCLAYIVRLLIVPAVSKLPSEYKSNSSLLDFRDLFETDSISFS